MHLYSWMQKSGSPELLLADYSVETGPQEGMPVIDVTAFNGRNGHMISVMIAPITHRDVYLILAFYDAMNCVICIQYTRALNLFRQKKEFVPSI